MYITYVQNLSTNNNSTALSRGTPKALTDLFLNALIRIKMTAEIIYPGHFDPRMCYQQQDSNLASLHPTVEKFLNLSSEQISTIYLHRHPNVSKTLLLDFLQTPSKFYKWGGSDMMPHTNAEGTPEMKLIEVNCCPGGASFAPPTLNVHRTIIQHSVMPELERTTKEAGVLAVLYNLPKNRPDIYGYAAALADLANEDVFLIDIGQDESVPRNIDWDSEGRMWLSLDQGHRVKVRVAFKRLGLKPWTVVPIVGKTTIINPSVVCFAGGHNKIAAAKAFESFDKKYSEYGLSVNRPLSFVDVGKGDVPRYFQLLNHCLAVKVPYSAAGADVHLISGETELTSFMDDTSTYDNYIVQQLLQPPFGQDPRNKLRSCKLTNPDGDFIYDLRFLIVCGPQGWTPVYVLGRRADQSFRKQSKETRTTADILKTNVSRINTDGSHKLKESVALILTEEVFDCMGLSIDDLVEGFVQSMLGVLAVDHQCQELIDQNGHLDLELFRKITPDARFQKEIQRGSPMVFKS